MTRPHLNPKLVVGVIFVMSLFMVGLDVTIVNVALPTIGNEFHVPPTGFDDIVTSYLISLTIVIPASGWLGDRFGTKRILLIAIALFVCSSALCGQARNLTELAIFRICQGVGGGMLTPVGMAILYRTFTSKERIRASRILTIPTVCGPAIGPVLGGFFVSQLSWRWVFYINLPIGALAFTFSALFLTEHSEERPGRFDLPGFVLAAVGLSTIMYAISEGPTRGWTSWEISGSAALGIVFLSILIAFELRTSQPMLDLRLFKNRLFRTSNIVLFFSALTFLGCHYMVTIFYQDGLGLSALASGLSTVPLSIGIMIGAQVVVRIYPIVGPRRLMVVGELGVALVLFLTVFTNYHTTIWYMRVLMLLIGIFQGQVNVPAQATSFATVASASIGRAAGLSNSLRQFGGALGIAILTTVLAVVGTSHGVARHGRPDLLGFKLAFFVTGGLALFGAIAAYFIHDADAASTMYIRKKAFSRSASNQPPVVETAGT